MYGITVRNFQNKQHQYVYFSTDFENKLCTFMWFEINQYFKLIIYFWNFSNNTVFKTTLIITQNLQKVNKLMREQTYSLNKKIYKISAIKIIYIQ